MENKYDPRLPEFLRDYLHSTEEDHAPQKLHLVSALTASATIFGRRVSLNSGYAPLYPNDYLMIVGDPGTGKSSALKRMSAYLRHAGYQNFAPQKTTIQKLIAILDSYQNRPAFEQKPSTFSLKDARLVYDAEMLIAVDELSVFLSAGESNRDFISVLTDLYDHEDAFNYETVKGVSAHIRRPTINVAVGTTPSEFHAIFGNGAASGGLMSRFLIASAFDEGVRRFEALKPSPEAVLKVVSGLQRMMQFEKVLAYSESGYLLATEIYEQKTEKASEKLQHFYARRGLRGKKLALNLAAMRGEAEISIVDVTLAHTIISYFEMHLPRVLGEYGTASDSIVAQKIMQALATATKPMNTRQLMQFVDVDVTGKDVLQRTLSKLLESEKIQQVEGGFLPVAAQFHYKIDKYVDWSLLRGILPQVDLDALLHKP